MWARAPADSGPGRRGRDNAHAPRSTELLARRHHVEGRRRLPALWCTIRTCSADDRRGTSARSGRTIHTRRIAVVSGLCCRATIAGMRAALPENDVLLDLLPAAATPATTFLSGRARTA